MVKFCSMLQLFLLGYANVQRGEPVYQFIKKFKRKQGADDFPHYKLLQKLPEA